MYVCLCNGYTDKDISKAVKTGGARCADSAYKIMGEGFNCGSCRDIADCIVKDVLAGRAHNDQGPDILPDPAVIAAE